MAPYVVGAMTTAVRSNPSPTASKRGDLKQGQQIEITDQQDG
jgi:hypothetical protein